MATLKELGALSEDVYNRSDNKLSRRVGYTRSDPQNWTAGFAGGAYRKQGETVVAFRGTDDGQDMVSNAMMVPLLEPGAARNGLRAMAEELEVDDDLVMSRVLPSMAEDIMSRRSVRNRIARSANRVPEQLDEALAYLDRQSPTPSWVTGHSLGGALAQLVGEARGVPAVAFNSPNLGFIGGATPVTSTGILLFNARLDPLSLVTREVGNPAHGRVESVEVARFRRPPSRTRREFRWRDILTPIPVRVAQRVRSESEHYAALISYLLEAMFHYHGIGTLNTYLGKHGRYNRTLATDFSGL